VPLAINFNYEHFDGGITSHVRPSWSPGTDRLHIWIVIQSINDDASTGVDPTMSGNGLTWTKVIEREGIHNDAEELSKITVFAAVGSGSTGTTTVSWGVQNQPIVTIYALDITGHDTAKTPAQLIPQDDWTQGTTGTGTVTLGPLGAYQHADSRQIAVVCHNSTGTAKGASEGANWEEQDDTVNSAMRTALYTNEIAQDNTFVADAATSTNIFMHGLMFEVNGAPAAGGGGGGSPIVVVAGI
jgi:hypothetical protein